MLTFSYHIQLNGLLTLYGLAFCTLFAACLPPPQQATAKLPNIVFIMADDMGQGDLGCYNPDSKIPTPAMDALAAEGMRFIDAHSPSSVCTPTRYGVLTGRYAWRTDLQWGTLNGVPWDRLPPSWWTPLA